MFFTIFATAAALTVDPTFNVIDFRLSSAVAAWQTCIDQQALNLKASNPNDLTTENRVELAEHQCWVMRYAVRDALPDAARKHLRSEGVKALPPYDIDQLADEMMKGVEAKVHASAMNHK